MDEDKQQNSSKDDAQEEVIVVNAEDEISVVASTATKHTSTPSSKDKQQNSSKDDAQEEVIVVNAEDEISVVASTATTHASTPSSTATRHRSRPRRQHHVLSAETLRAQLAFFEKQNHSLRVSASNVAAMAGFHPYKNLPELALDMAYQGSLGRALLQADAQLLEMKLVSPDQVLRDLAAKAGAATQSALVQALQVKHGTKVVASVQEAQTVKQAVIQEAKAKLSETELKVLQEGVRHAVNTGYGVSNEDDALDLYELECGWTVRERNAEIRVWPFRRSEDLEDYELKQSQTGSSIQRVSKTAVPLRKAVPLWNPTEEVAEIASSTDDGEDCAEPGNAKRPKSAESSESLAGSDNNEKCDKVSELARDTDEETSGDNDKQCKGTRMAVHNYEKSKPYFLILGSVDGIRDELVPSMGTADDDDSWILKQVVVECKHRMKAIRNSPPLYDQIQTAVYCLMYEVNDADIVQVLRRAETPSKKERKETGTNEDKKTPAPNNATLDNWVVREEGHAEKEQQSNEEETARADEKKPARPKPIIASTRVSLDDPITQHRLCWESIVLPRLRSFVDAVYEIRSTPDKRYRLLSSTSDLDQRMELGWQLLHELCPWLKECDTAFFQERL